VALALLGLVWPWLVAIPLSVISGWVGFALLVRARALRRANPPPGPAESRNEAAPPGRHRLAADECEAAGGTDTGPPLSEMRGRCRR
jgi:hypothetical protein